MATQIFKTKEEKEPFYRGLRGTAEMTASTYGADGHTVIISHGHGSMPDICKDGVTVVRSVMDDDELECMGSTLLKDAANKSVTATGDGTTATVILTTAILNEGLNEIEAGARHQFVKKGIEKGVKAVVEYLKRNSFAIDENKEELLNVATISANNDPELGQIIADAYKKVGKAGLLTVEKSPTAQTYSKVVDGFEFQRGYLHEYFSNTEKLQAVHNNPLIMLADYTISKFAQIQKIAEDMLKTGRPIIIIAADYDNEAYGTILQNKMKGILNICLIKAPNAYKKEYLDDIAVLTGATVIRDDAGLKLESAEMKHIGGCDKIIVTNNITTLVKGHGEEEPIERRKKEIQTIIDGIEHDPEYKEVVEKRLAKLCGTVGVVYVGAVTESEAKEKYYRVEDAIRAVKSALEEGICAGGGAALLRAAVSKELEGLIENEEGVDVQRGIKVVQRALFSPVRQLLYNAGMKDEIDRYIAEILSKSDINYGFNIKTGQFENLKESGVIDPTKVIRVALENAASLAATILGSEYLLVEMKER
jgi:chaperonin GroEL